VARIRDLAEPLVDMVGPTPYPGLFPPEDPEFHPSAVARTMFVDSVDGQVAEVILEHLASSDAPIRVAQLRVLGGAIARVPVNATAFAHRNSRIMLNVAAFYDGPEDFALREAWVVDFAAAMQQGDTGAYIGFLGDEGPERTRAAYPGKTWERLRAVKARYDPTNLFRLNHNIPPA
jgi:FAD/FMN-containing dehydrogenase